MGHRQTNPNIANKLKIKKAFWPFPLFLGENILFAFCLSTADIPPFFRFNCEGGQLVQTDHPTSLRRKTQKMPLEKKKKDRWIFPGPGLLSAPLKISIGGGGGHIWYPAKSRERKGNGNIRLKTGFLFRSSHASFLSDRGCQTSRGFFYFHIRYPGKRGVGRWQISVFVLILREKNGLSVDPGFSLSDLPHKKGSSLFVVNSLLSLVQFILWETKLRNFCLT